MLTIGVSSIRVEMSNYRTSRILDAINFVRHSRSLRNIEASIDECDTPRGSPTDGRDECLAWKRDEHRFLDEDENKGNLDPRAQ